MLANKLITIESTTQFYEIRVLSTHSPLRKNHPKTDDHTTCNEKSINAFAEVVYMKLSDNEMFATAPQKAPTNTYLPPFMRCS